MDTNQQPQVQQLVNTTPVSTNNSSKSKIIPIGLGILFVLIAIGAYVLGTKQTQTVVSNQQNTITSTITQTPTPFVTLTPEVLDIWKMNTVFVGEYDNQLLLRYNGENFNDFTQRSDSGHELDVVTLQDPAKVNWMKVAEGPINPKGSNEPFSFKAIPGNKNAIIVMRWSRGDGDPETVSDYSLYRVFIYDTASKNTKEITELRKNQFDEGYNVPKIDQISSDGQYLSFQMFSCWNCGGHYPEVLLYNVSQDKLKRIGRVLGFRWINGDQYQYKEYKEKPCGESHQGPGPCLEDPSNLPYITASF